MKLYHIYTFILLWAVQISAAQESVISGKIIHQSGYIMQGATVALQGTQISTKTNNKGEYSLKTALKNSQILEVYFDSRKVKEIRTHIKGNETINVTITDDDLYQEKKYDLEEIVVTGKSVAQKVKEKAFNVSVVEATKLHNTTLDLGHALDKVSGIRVRESGGVGSDMSLSMNGFRGKQVKFFIDGIPMENFGSSFQLNNIPINLAKRIEVYKGVVPVSLGADALGGAINIISNIYEKSHLDVSYSYGSFNTHRSMLNAIKVWKSGLVFQANAFQNYSDNNYKIQVDVADIDTGKYFPNQTVRRFHDTYRNETFIGKIGVTNKPYADQLFVGITLGKNYKEIQNGARIVTVYGNWHRRGNIVMPSLVYQKNNLFIKGLDFKLNANINLGQEQNIDTINRRYNWFQQYRQNPTKGGERNYSLYKFRNNNGLVTANWDYKPNSYHTFSLNNTFTTFSRVGFDELNPNNQIYEKPQKTNKNIVGLGYQHSQENWNLSVFGKSYYQRNSHNLAYNPSGRYGDVAYMLYNNTFKYFGYGIAYTHFLHKNLQLKTSFEKSYRLPENDELFGDMINLQGNVSLKPESSHNVNLGASYWLNWANKNQMVFHINGFYRNAKDFIYARLNTNQIMQTMDNLGKTIGKGIEAEISYKYGNNLSAGANITYQDLRDNEREDLYGRPSIVYRDRIPNIPYLYGNADASYTFYRQKDLTISAGYNLLYVHKFYLYWPSLGSVKLQVPEQIAHDINLTATYKKWQFTLECRNILDKAVYDNFSLQKPGRSFTGKIKWQIL